MGCKINIKIYYSLESLTEQGHQFIVTNEQLQLQKEDFYDFTYRYFNWDGKK